MNQPLIGTSTEVYKLAITLSRTAKSAASLGGTTSVWSVAPEQSLTLGYETENDREL